MAGMRRGGAVASDWNLPHATRSGRMGTKVLVNDTLTSIEDLKKIFRIARIKTIFLSVARDSQRLVARTDIKTEI